MKSGESREGGQRFCTLTFYDDTSHDKAGHDKTGHGETRHGETTSSDGGALRNRLVMTGRIVEPEIVALRDTGEQWLSTLSGGSCEVDLAGVDSASSILLSLLLCWRRQANAQGLDVRFAGANDRLKALAVMGRVDDQLPGFST